MPKKEQKRKRTLTNTIVVKENLLKKIPKRKKESHKGENGRVLVIGGSDEISGAPALAGMAALASMRSGTDLCVICTTEKTGQAIKAHSPDLIVKKCSGKHLGRRHLKKMLLENKKTDVTIIGPGIGMEKETVALVKELVKKCLGKIVIDADAIKACSGMKFAKPVLITPHSKEFEIFTRKKLNKKTNIKINGKLKRKVNDQMNEKIKLVKEAAAKHHCVILLKGKTDIISDGKRVLINKTGNAGMTKGGTGDVLAGICSALCARGVPLLEAGAIAAFVNGKIGEKLSKKQGYSFLASDFIEELKHWGKRIAK